MNYNVFTLKNIDDESAMGLSISTAPSKCWKNILNKLIIIYIYLMAFNAINYNYDAYNNN